MLGPPLLIGERVVHQMGAEHQAGTVRWLGRIPAKFGDQMVVGVELVSASFYRLNLDNGEDIWMQHHHQLENLTGCCLCLIRPSANEFRLTDKWLGGLF